MAQLLLVGLGGAVGAMMRFAGAQLVGVHVFPWATLIINIAGAVLIGALWGACAGAAWFDAWGRSLLVTGVLGGFTTFSAFSLETLQLLDAGRWLSAVGYVSASVLLCVLGCWLGYRMAA